MKFALAIALGFVVTFLFITGIGYVATERACGVWEKETDRELKFVAAYPWYADCLIKTDSGWISGSHLYQNETPDLNASQ